MDVGEFVDGKGWISDDSAFYGDDDIRQSHEEMARRAAKRPYQMPMHQCLKKIKLDIGSVEIDLGRDEEGLPASHRHQVTSPKASTQSSSHTDREEPNTIAVDFFKGRHRDSWQQTETIDEFLLRLPVNDPQTASVGPWIWVGSPIMPRQHAESLQRDTGDFVERARAFLERFSHPPGQGGEIPRKLIPNRNQLESDLLTIAMEHGKTVGKWMLFPDPSELPHVWRVVATATARGELGVEAKAGTPTSGQQHTLICIYTYDFSDHADVRRILLAMVDLDLVTPGGKPVYYKCDAYTDLNITSTNPFNLKASLFSSKELLRDTVVGSNNPSVARSKKRIEDCRP